MNKIINWLKGLKEKSHFIAAVIILVMIIAIAGVGITLPFIVSGVVATLGAILLDLCAIPMFIELIKVLTE